MNEFTKQIISCAFSLVVLISAYLGSYLPYKQSTDYINLLRSQDSIKTIEDFKSRFAAVLDSPSPIGAEELTRNLATIVTNVVQYNGKESPAVAEEVINFLDSYYAPLLAKPRGLSFGQDLYVLGSLNEVAFIQTNNPKYLAASKSYYLRGLELSPNRPQYLYGAFDVYRMEGNEAKIRETADKILTLWPNDEKTKNVYAEVLKEMDRAKGAKTPTSTPKVAPKKK